MAKLEQFLQGHPKLAFSEKVQKSSPRLKGLKAPWRKWHYPLISMRLNFKE